MKLSVYFALTPRRRGLRAWLFSGVLRLVEGKSYNHVFGVLEDDLGTRSCWNIFSWSKPWSEYSPQNVIDSYDIEKKVEIDITATEYANIRNTFEGFVGRHYAVGRLLLIPLYRLTRWDFLTDPPGVTCTYGLGRALQNAEMWNNQMPPAMAGLEEVENVVDGLQRSRDKSLN